MNEDEFRKKVAEMRFFQKEAERWHLKRDRIRARALEKEIDAETRRSLGDVKFGPESKSPDLPSLFQPK